MNKKELIREDYMLKLIMSCRSRIDKEMASARESEGLPELIGGWCIDVELLCITVEKALAELKLAEVESIADKHEIKELKKDEWVEITERKPKRGQAVDIWSKEKGRLTDIIFGRNIMTNYTHWKPINKPMESE